MYLLKLRAYDVESNTFLCWRATIFLNLAFHRVEVVHVLGEEDRGGWG
jgi:hypothetical protein